MIRLYIRHRVADYDVWRRGYDAGAPMLHRERGLIGAGIYRTIEDPNDVTVWHDFETEAEARAFAGLPELHASMARIGVEDPPTIWITRDVT